MARRIGFIGPAEAPPGGLIVPALGTAEMRIRIPGTSGFDVMAIQGSIDQTSLATLATSPIRVRQFDIQRQDTGRIVSLIGGGAEPNFVELFGQRGDAGEVPREGGEPLDRASDVILTFRNTDVVAHTVDLGLRGVFDTDKTPNRRAPAGAKFIRSSWLNGRVTLPAVANAEERLIIRIPGDGPFTWKGIAGIVNDIPFPSATVVGVRVLDMKVRRPGSGSIEDLIDGAFDFMSFVGQNGTPARLPIHEAITEDTDIEFRLRNTSSGPVAVQNVSLTLIGTIEQGPAIR